MSGQAPTAANKIGTNAGNRGRGRPKGALNKTTATAKEAIALVFDQIGGEEALAAWATASDDNRKVFYAQIWTKILPLQVNGAGDDGAHIHKIMLEAVSPK